MTRNETPKPRRNVRQEEPPAQKPDVAAAAQSSGGDAKPSTRQRISKVMARAGLCSRREAEAWVLAGRVSVNGEVLSTPARDVEPDDTIMVDGQPLPTAEKTRLFLFHKPRGLITSDHDPEGRDTVFDFLRENWPEGPRVVTVGRLDINTEGLLLLTNDGGLARILELPETGWLRRYRVRAKGQTDQAALDALAHGLVIEGVEYAGIEAKLDRIQGSNSWLTMGLREGKNREIKRVLEHLGLEVNRLIRLSFGPFQLLELPEGAVEEVRTRVLRDQLGENLAAAAGVDFGDDEAMAARVSEGERERPERTRGKQPGSRPATLTLTGRAGSRPAGRQEQREEQEPKAERLERSQDGPRRHVSALRVTETSKEGTGQRKRIERTATRDRHDRPVAVERLITRDTPPRSQGRKKTSLSAEAKQVRVARSGGEASRPRGGDEPRRGRPRTYGEGAGHDVGSTLRPPPRSSSGSTAEGRDGGRPRRNEADRPRREAPEAGRSRSAPRERSRDDVERKSPSDAGRPPKRFSPRDGGAGGERRSERQARPTSASPRNRDNAGAEAGGRKRSFDKSSSERASSGRPSSGKPFSARSSSDATTSGKPRIDKQRFDRPSGRPKFGEPTSEKAQGRRPPSGRSFGKPASDKSSDKPFSGRPRAGKSSASKPFSGRPSPGRPPSGRPSSGRPSSGRPATGRSGSRPGGSTKPKR